MRAGAVLQSTFVTQFIPHGAPCDASEANQTDGTQKFEEAS